MMDALINHIWQSTVFGAAAAVLALALRNNHARARYWLWLSASVKFLVPFSAFVAIGARVPLPARSTPAAVSGAVQEIGGTWIEPLWPSAPVHSAPHLLPLVLLAIWICGSIAVAAVFAARWLKMRAVVRGATPSAVRAGVPVLSTKSAVEPGVFGVWRPVLLLPEGIVERLAPEQLAAILAHEMCHVRRHDNVFASLHMLVEAIFWFHPLVWWLGARLVDERERACDEEVLHLGSEPQVYAEGILRVCKFYVESPAFCVSGVTGADLKKRIVRIMTQRMAERLDFTRKALLAGAAVTAIALPVAFGLLRAQSEDSAAGNPKFEVASIKPSNSDVHRVSVMFAPGGRFVATNLTVKMLMRNAYKLQEFQISGAPGWMDSDRFDIEAKAEAEAMDPRKMTPQERDADMERRRLMLQSLLADRFGLKFHKETKEMPVYALVVAKNGPKIHEAPAPTPASDGGSAPPRPQMRGLRIGRGDITGQTDLAFFIDVLGMQV